MRTITAIVAPALIASLTAAQAEPLYTHYGTLLDAVDVSPYLDVCDKVANTPSQGTSWTMTVAGQQLSYSMNWLCEDHKLTIWDGGVGGFDRHILRPGAAHRAAEAQSCFDDHQCHNLGEWQQLAVKLCALSKDADVRMKAQEQYYNNQWYGTPKGIAAQHQQEITSNADDKCLSAKVALSYTQQRVDEAAANEAHMDANRTGVPYVMRPDGTKFYCDQPGAFSVSGCPDADH